MYIPYISVVTLPFNVQLVNIYLSTATFDEIEKDVKVTNYNEGAHGSMEWEQFS